VLDHDPLRCIVPPYMLEAIKVRGTDEQRRFAARIDEQAAAYRSERVARAPEGGFLVAPVEAEPPGPKREVYDAGGTMELPGKLVRSEGEEPTGDAPVDEAYEGAGHTYAMYAEVHGRDSLDGKGMTLVSSVHVGEDYDNAFWDGRQMAYGDGGMIFKPLTGSLSVIGHELSHGVVQFSGGLVYRDQAGALNESFADVFGALVEQRQAGQGAAEASWLIGGALLREEVSGEALRSMKAPGTAYDDEVIGTDPQPFHMSEYIVTSADNGGVHINSGIPNHAFYLLAQYLGGNAWEKAGHIWYEALQAINNPHATFADWADETCAQARERFGAGSREELFTRRSWQLVGVEHSG
jgi:Zn-dependent metalloprotease